MVSRQSEKLSNQQECYVLSIRMTSWINYLVTNRGVKHRGLLPSFGTPRLMGTSK